MYSITTSLKSQSVNFLDQCDGIIPTLPPSHPPQTLCEKYGSQQDYVVWDNNIATNGILYSSQFGASVTDLKINLKNDLYIDDDFTFQRCTLKIEPGVNIYIIADRRLSLNYSFLFCCSLLWHGIDLDSYSQIIINYSQIEDAEKVIYSNNDYAALYLNSSIFNRNKTGIELEYADVSPIDPHGHPPGNPIHDYPGPRIASINNFIIDCTSNINDGTKLSEFGILTHNVPIFIITSNGFVRNFIRNQNIGIQSYGLNILNINNVNFNDNFSSSIATENGILELNKCFFTNGGKTTVSVKNTISTNITLCEFNNKTYAKYKNFDFTSVRILSLNPKSRTSITNNRFNCLDDSPADPLPNTKNKSIEVKGNNIGNGSIIKIENNILSGRSAYYYGIVFDGIFPKSCTTSIKLNQIYFNIYNGNDVDGRSAIGLINGAKNNFTITENTIDNFWGLVNSSGNPKSSNLIGIFLDGSMNGGNNVITKNNFTTYNPSYLTVWASSGIKINNFGSAYIAENEFQNCCNYSMDISGINNLQLRCNKFYGNEIFRLNNSLITPQNYNSNQWLGWPKVSPIQYSTQDALCLNCTRDALKQSKFNMHETQTIWNGINLVEFHATHPGHVSPDVNNEWFEYIANQVPSCIAGFKNSTDEINTLEAMLTIDQDTVYNTTVANEFFQRQFYNSIHYENTAILSLSSSINSFYNDYSSTEFGKIANIEQSINQSEQTNPFLLSSITSVMDSIAWVDSLIQQSDILMASSLNPLDTQELNDYFDLSGIQMNLLRTLKNSLSQAEQNTSQAQQNIIAQIQNNSSNQEHVTTELKMMEYLLKLKNGINLTSVEMNFILDLANQCPEVEGNGVYISRSLIQCNEYKNWDTCYGSNNNQQIKSNVNSHNQSSVLSNYQEIGSPQSVIEYFILSSMNGNSVRYPYRNLQIESLNIPDGLYLVRFYNSKNELVKSVKLIKAE
ncbi:MAG: hypothetical protein K1X68_00890 [Saprospiraceae bacterium]|nr:hypothetical protein [Saprospiraceae bacterium]HMW38501.1 hypothetical protein [Saprospiraceae bacterium]HMX88365.1 hypothetical protein [Saprospiraceae bacterium]HMZ40257.1 hypothetical protein [Saprospiraceae bacterium]HNA65116.1 hypothetical protein [Saprospiraceae bacterium]